MTRTPGLADTAVLVIQVAHLSDGCHTEDVYTALFTGRQTYQRIVALFSHQLGACPRAPHHLTPTPFFQLNVVNGGAGRDILEGQRIAWPDISLRASHYPIANFELIRCDDIALLAIQVVQESDARRA